MLVPRRVLTAAMSSASSAHFSFMAALSSPSCQSAKSAGHLPLQRERGKRTWQQEKNNFYFPGAYK